MSGDSCLSDLYQPTPHQPTVVMQGFEASVAAKAIPQPALIQRGWGEQDPIAEAPTTSFLRDLEVEAAMAQAAPQPTLLLQGLEGAEEEAKPPQPRPQSPSKC